MTCWTYNEVETFAGSSIAATGSIAGYGEGNGYLRRRTPQACTSRETVVKTSDGFDRASATSGHFTGGCRV